MVAILIFGVIGTYTTVAVINGTRAAHKGQQRVYAYADLQRGLERISKELRAADPLVLSTSGDYGTELGATVYRTIDGAERRVEYNYRTVDTGDGTDLVQDVTIFSDRDGSTVMSDEDGLFIENVNNNETQPLFSYYDRSGDQITCPSSPCDDLINAAQVEVRLIKDLPEQDDVAASTIVTIRNTRTRP